VTVLARGPVSPGLLDALGVLRETRGANVWLVAPNDDAVFWGVRTQAGMVCAHPLQVYLDLKAHPERSSLLGGRRVDLRTPRELSRYFREGVMREVEVQYVAG
jgi:hypothetical protein